MLNTVTAHQFEGRPRQAKKGHVGEGHDLGKQRVQLILVLVCSLMPAFIQ